MQTTQYKVIYLDENQDRKARTCLDLAAVGHCQTTLFRVLSVIPQLVVDQIADSDALLKQARLDHSSRTGAGNCPAADLDRRLDRRRPEPAHRPGPPRLPRRPGSARGRGLSSRLVSDRSTSQANLRPTVSRR